MSAVHLSDEERTGHLPKLVEDLVVRLSRPGAAASKDSGAVFSEAAVAHGKLRYEQGYTPAMLVHESRILQVTLFGTLQSNLSFLDFSLLLPDVMTIADEVDAQLTQSMDSYMSAEDVSGSIAVTTLPTVSHLAVSVAGQASVPNGLAVGKCLRCSQ